MKTIFQTLFALLLCTSCAFDRQGVGEIQNAIKENAEQMIAAVESLVEGTATPEAVVAQIIEQAEETSQAFVGIAQRSTARNLNGVAKAAGGLIPGVSPIVEIVGSIGAAAFAAYASKRAVDSHGANLEQRAVDRVNRERNLKYENKELRASVGATA